MFWWLEYGAPNSYHALVQLCGSRNPKNTWCHCHHWLVWVQFGVLTYEILSRAPRCHQPSLQTSALVTLCRDLYQRSLSLTVKKAAQISALGTHCRWSPVFPFSLSSDRVVKNQHVRGSVSCFGGSYIIVIILSSIRPTETCYRYYKMESFHQRSLWHHVFW